MFDWDEVPEHLGGPNKAALDIEAEAKGLIHIDSWIHSFPD